MTALPTTARRVLVIGIGNPGRLDDGLGPALAEAIERLALPGVTVEANYQLTVEDAAEVARHDVVVFADAAVSGPEPFWVERVRAGTARLGFSSHSVEPRAVLALARDLFGAEPEAYVVGIRGHAFHAFGERLSEPAQAHLAAACSWLEGAVRTGHFRGVRSPRGSEEFQLSDRTVEGD